MTLLELLKERGKALVIQGPQGCGKTLLAKQLAEAVGDTVVIREDELQSRFNSWLKNKIVIVEDFSGTETSPLGKIKSLIAMDEVVCERKMRDPVMIKTPQFIFCTSNPEPLNFGANDRRFFVIKIGTQV